MKSKLLKKQKGITLVALVVTIVILIILAGISIIVLIGENGIINRAKQAKILNEKASTISEIQLKLLEIETQALEEGKKITNEDIINLIKSEKYVSENASIGINEDSDIVIDENGTLLNFKPIEKNYRITLGELYGKELSSKNENTQENFGNQTQENIEEIKQEINTTISSLDERLTKLELKIENLNETQDEDIADLEEELTNLKTDYNSFKTTIQSKVNTLEKRVGYMTCIHRSTGSGNSISFPVRTGGLSYGLAVFGKTTDGAITPFTVAYSYKGTQVITTNDKYTVSISNGTITISGIKSWSDITIIGEGLIPE